jgi:hypothetical protein
VNVEPADFDQVNIDFYPMVDMPARWRRYI